MIVGALDKALLVSGPALDAIFCLTMLIRRRVRSFSAVFAFGFLDVVSGPVLYFVDPGGASASYVRAYVAYDITSFLLQLYILLQLARAVLRPAGMWERGAAKPLVLAGGVGALLAIGAASLLEPSGIHSLEAIQLRAEIFAGLLACELVVAMMLSAKEVGLPWRSHAMAIGQGLMLWSLVASTVEGLEAYMGPHDTYYRVLYYVRSISYLLMIGYWTVSLWREEPARKPISPALRKYVVALHERVQYDLGKAGH